MAEIKMADITRLGFKIRYNQNTAPRCFSAIKKDITIWHSMGDKSIASIWKIYKDITYDKYLGIKKFAENLEHKTDLVVFCSNHDAREILYKNESAESFELAENIAYGLYIKIENPTLDIVVDLLNQLN